jgi:hypothetical protein
MNKNILSIVDQLKGKTTTMKTTVDSGRIRTSSTNASKQIPWKLTIPTTHGAL